MFQKFIFTNVKDLKNYKKKIKTSSTKPKIRPKLESKIEDNVKDNVCEDDKDDNFTLTTEPNKEIDVKPTKNIITGFKNVKTIVKDNSIVNSIIPLCIFQTWSTLNLPPKMNLNMEYLKLQNPEFTHYLYDDYMCRDFISKNFDNDVLYTFDKLKPGKFKADLWKYCILYKNGGIYLDIKYHCTNNFKLIYLTDKEYFVKDKFTNGYQYINNSLLVCLPYNNILLKTIYNIVENVKNTIYPNNFNNHSIESSAATGSLLLSNQFNIKEIEKMHLKISEYHNYIKFNNLNILEVYKGYFFEKNNNKYRKHSLLFKKTDIYNFLYLKPINKINLSRRINKNINDNKVDFFTSNPCIIKHPCENKYIMNIRWINYSLDKDGVSTLNYHKTISLNSLIEIDSSFNVMKEIFLNEICDYTDEQPYFGYEDIRLFNYSDKIYYTGSSYNEVNNTVSITSDECKINKHNYIFKKNFITPTFYKYKRVEKNWCFVNYQQNMCVVYSWFPLTICKIDYVNSTLDILERKYIKTDYFKNVKGSSCGFEFKDEIWFVIHKSQSNNDKQFFNYQQFFAVFDLNMNLLRYSELFKLNNCRIEFCIGLIIEEDRTILSFSSLDTNIYIGVYDNDYIKSIKWYNEVIIDL